MTTQVERRKLTKKERMRIKFETLNDIYDDLPDGAWTAVMEENGFDAATIAWLNEDES